MQEITFPSAIPTKKASFLSRFYQYQKERFPLLGHGVLIAVFTFSAISYARICRGVEGFIPMTTYWIGVFTTISLFLLVRIFDEFKDAEEDALYRKELPVPRGLISLTELFWVGVLVFILQVIINAIFFPKMLLLFGVVILWLCLMGKEFFIADWLKKHPFWYVSSHMLIIPLVDVYASGLDWFLVGETAPKGLLFFFAVSFMNGVVLEIGRKIRTPEQEKEGVQSYTSMLGTKKAVWLWIGILILTLVLSLMAAFYANLGGTSYIILLIAFLLCAFPACLFLKNPTIKLAQFIEKISALWTILMYLSLGAIPMLQTIWNQ